MPYIPSLKKVQIKAIGIIVGDISDDLEKKNKYNFPDDPTSLNTHYTNDLITNFIHLSNSQVCSESIDHVSTVTWPKKVLIDNFTARKAKYSGPNSLEYGPADAAYTAMFWRIRFRLTRNAPGVSYLNPACFSVFKLNTREWLEVFDKSYGPCLGRLMLH